MVIRDTLLFAYIWCYAGFVITIEYIRKKTRTIFRDSYKKIHKKCQSNLVSCVTLPPHNAYRSLEYDEITYCKFTYGNALYIIRYRLKWIQSFIFGSDLTCLFKKQLNATQW